MFSSLPEDENTALALYEEASAALDAETEDELWNPLEVIEKIKKAESKVEKLQWKKVLIEKFLDQKNPVVATQMKDFLSEDGVTEIFVGFLTRLAPEAVPTSLDNVVEVQKKKTIRSVVTPETETAVKRSFRLMKIFLAPTKEFERLLTTKLNVIVRELFKIFYPDAQGNFHHFKAILEQLLTTRFVNETVKVILNDELFTHMFDYLHEAPVVEAALAIFTCQFRTPHEANRFYSSVNESRVFDILINKIANTNKDNWDSTFAADFFIRLIDRLAAIDAAGILFTGLARTPKTMEKLLTTLTSKEKNVSSEQKKSIASVIRELLTRGSLTMATIDPFTEQQKTVPNMLSPVSAKLHDYAIKFIAPLCDELERLDNMSKSSEETPIEFSSYKVSKPFGMNRLVLTEILSDLIVTSPKSIEAMTPGIWKVLSSWFFEYSNNNIYHCHMWKIVQTAFVNYQIEAVKSLLSKNKFATNLVRAFDDPTKASSRGFIIKYCNLIRLAADADSSQGYLRNFVTSHDVFKPFIPRLIAETEKQLKIPLDTGRNIVQDTSIELGSQYAKSLGIMRTTPLPDPTPSKSTPTKPTTPSSSTSESPASATPGSTGAAKKKKKKKKKSTGGATSSSTSEESKEEESQKE